MRELKKLRIIGGKNRGECKRFELRVELLNGVY